jgi:hypothetical protein
MQARTEAGFCSDLAADEKRNIADTLQQLYVELASEELLHNDGALTGSNEAQ